jgi:hypothetical protein
LTLIINVMNKILIRIVIFISLFMFTGYKSFGQSVDSIRMKQTRAKEGQNQAAAGQYGKNQGPDNPAGNQNAIKNQNAGKSQAVKQVKSARPDMSKARGARPPGIVRPSGSGVPKGMGKPGGAGRRGGR